MDVVDKKAVIAVAVVAIVVASAVILVTVNGDKGNDGTYATGYPFLAYDHATGRNVAAMTYYEDSFFDRPSTEYNPDLMVFALCLELSCGYDSDDISRRPSSVLRLLRDIGCSDAVANEGFSTESTMTSTGVVVGSKQYGGSTIVFVALNGVYYHGAFASNVMIGKEGDHAGFSGSADDSIGFLRTFISDNGITGDVKILITGYSRTGAASNLMAARISDAIHDGRVPEVVGDVNLTKESLYGYCFSVPLCGHPDGEAGPDDPRYDNIWYFNNPNDPVTYVPPESYGFVRYGNKVTIPSDDSACTKRMLDRISDILGKDAGAKYDLSSFRVNPKAGINSIADLNSGFVSRFFESLGSREHYSEEIEEDFSRTVFAVMTHMGIVGEIIDESGGYTGFVTTLYDHYGKEDFRECFLGYVSPVCERNGCPEYSDSIVESLYCIAGLLYSYSDGKLMNLIGEPYFMSLVQNRGCILMSHYPFLNLCYLMQESSLY